MTAPISTTPVPAEVRADGVSGERLYDAALGFERILLSQLASGLADSAGTGGDGEDGDASTSMLAQLLPDALADSVGDAGGTGLALELYRSLRGAQP